MSWECLRHTWCVIVSVCMLCVQAIRVLGVLGALDPYRHKVHLGEVSSSSDSGAMSEAKPLQDASPQGTMSPMRTVVDSVVVIFFLVYARCKCLQCFDAVGWAAGRVSGL